MQFRGVKIGVQSVDGVWLREGDKVLMNVERVSSSHSHWCRKTNEHHGTYQVPAVICYVGAHFFPKYLTEHIKDLEKPRGREKFPQVVMYPQEDEAWWEQCFHVGSIYPSKNGTKTR